MSAVTHNTSYDGAGNIRTAKASLKTRKVIDIRIKEMLSNLLAIKYYALAWAPKNASVAIAPLVPLPRPTWMEEIELEEPPTQDDAVEDLGYDGYEADDDEEQLVDEWRQGVPEFGEEKEAEEGRGDGEIVINEDLPPLQRSPKHEGNQPASGPEADDDKDEELLIEGSWMQALYDDPDQDNSYDLLAPFAEWLTTQLEETEPMREAAAGTSDWPPTEKILWEPVAKCFPSKLGEYLEVIKKAKLLVYGDPEEHASENSEERPEEHREENPEEHPEEKPEDHSTSISLKSLIVRNIAGAILGSDGRVNLVSISNLKKLQVYLCAAEHIFEQTSSQRKHIKDLRAYYSRERRRAGRPRLRNDGLESPLVNSISANEKWPSDMEAATESASRRIIHGKEKPKGWAAGLVKHDEANPEDEWSVAQPMEEWD